MEDFFDDFEDDFDNDDFMDEDSFEDSLEGEIDEPFTDEPDHEEEPDEAKSQDDKFTAKDAFLAGALAAWAYEEGVGEGRRKRLLKEQSKRRKRKKKNVMMIRRLLRPIKCSDRPAVFELSGGAVWTVHSKNCNLNNGMISKSHAGLKFEYITAF